MACSGYTKVWELKPGELVGLDGARGTTLRVTRGTLWVTFERDVRDVVLSVGDVFTIDRGGLTLVEAQNDTTVCVMAHQIDMVHIRKGEPTLLQRALAWFAAASEATMRRSTVPYV